MAAGCFRDQCLPYSRQKANTWLISCRCSGQGLAELSDPCADQGAPAVSPTMPLLVSVAHAGAPQTATSPIHPHCAACIAQQGVHCRSCLQAQPPFALLTRRPGRPRVDSPVRLSPRFICSICSAGGRPSCTSSCSPPTVVPESFSTCFCEQARVRVAYKLLSDSNRNRW